MKSCLFEVNWIDILERTLPERLIVMKHELGEERKGESLEILVHGEIRKILRDIFPVTETLVPEFNISKDLGLPKGESAHADFCIFHPWSVQADGTKDLAAIVEVKRPYTDGPNTTRVLNDLARLAICSDKRKVPGYFILCGHVNRVAKELEQKSVKALLADLTESSAERNDVELTKSLTKNFDEKYQKLIKQNKIGSLATFRLTRERHHEIGFGCWRVSANKQRFANRPEILRFHLSKAD